MQPKSGSHFVGQRETKLIAFHRFLNSQTIHLNKHPSESINNNSGATNSDTADMVMEDQAPGE